MPDRKKLERWRILNKCFKNYYGRYTLQKLIEEVNHEMAVHFPDLPPVSRRTIQLDIEQMQGEPYNMKFVDKLYDGHQRVYRYANPYSDSIQFFQGLKDEPSTVLANAIDALNTEEFKKKPLLAWSLICLKKIINDEFVDDGLRYHENNHVVFQSNDFLHGIEAFMVLIEAIENHEAKKILYEPYQRPEREYKIFPYQLRQYNDRWFLIARIAGRNDLTNFALDRIKKVDTYRKKFEPCDIDLDEYFDEVVGVTVTKNEPVKVVLKVAKKRLPYIITKPIHPSQTELKDCETEDFGFVRLHVRPNRELESLILSFGEQVEVLEPMDLRQRIASQIQELNNKYSEF